MQALVFGYYGDQAVNIGDLLFKNAFKTLFPDINFIFTDAFTKDNIDNADCIIFGGGSFLESNINGSELLHLILKKKIFYIGVGIETDIHPVHQQLMKNALLIAPRNNFIDKISKLTNAQIIEIPDLVYILQKPNIPSVIPKSILVLPNAEVIPRHNDLNWRYSAWAYFKSEMSQALDILKSEGYIVKFAPLCIIEHVHDLCAATEIINGMQFRSFYDQINFCSLDFNKIIETIAQFETIITQRYHGAILADIIGRPHITIAHHDKLKNATKSSITLPYYEISKQKIYNAFCKAKNSTVLPIKLDKFEDLREAFYSKIGTKCPNLSESKTVRFK